ncbi:MAG: hypothetical protein Q8P67_04100 [archaeon]|nr:hypothetical protein [archaeon]
MAVILMFESTGIPHPTSLDGGALLLLLESDDRQDTLFPADPLNPIPTV